MKKFFRAAAPVLAGLLFPPFLLYADIFTMKDGKTYEGEIVGEDSGMFFIEADHDVIKISKTDLLSKKETAPRSKPSATAAENPKPVPAAFKKTTPSNDGPEQMEMLIKAGGQMNALSGLLNPSESNKGLPEKMQQWMESVMSMPAFEWIFAFMNEAKAKARLRELGTRAVVYTMEYDHPPSTMSALVQKGGINPDYQKPNFEGYKYSVETTSREVIVKAMPANPHSILKGLILHTESGRIEEVGGSKNAPSFQEMMEKKLQQI